MKEYSRSRTLSLCLALFMVFFWERNQAQEPETAKLYVMITRLEVKDVKAELHFKKELDLPSMPVGRVIQCRIGTQMLSVRRWSEKVYQLDLVGVRIGFSSSDKELSIYTQSHEPTDANVVYVILAHSWASDGWKLKRENEAELECFNLRR